MPTPENFPHIIYALFSEKLRSYQASEKEYKFPIFPCFEGFFSEQFYLVHAMQCHNTSSSESGLHEMEWSTILAH